jgi:uncharacterized protein (DUF1800 family)
MASLALRSGTLGRRLSAHLLRRATFGATQGEIDSFAGLTANQALDQLLTMPPLPDHPQDPQTGATWVLTGRTNANTSNRDLKRIINSWYLHQLNAPVGPPSLFHKLVFFLHTSWVTGHDVVEYSEHFYYTLRLFMQMAQGDCSYRDLAVKVCLDNGMNDFLDIGDSEAGNPNENFARELFELFTVGKGPTIGPGDYTTFTENDVYEAARLLTGYRRSDDWADLTRQDPDTGLPRCWFDPSKHDSADKLFSAAFQDTIIAGQTSETGMIEEVEALIDMIMAQEATARYICRRMYRFFVRRIIDQEVEDDIIGPLAQTLLQNNYALRPALRLLLASEHFYDDDDSDAGDEVIGSLVKSPLELQVGMWRYFRVPMPDPAADLFHAYVTVYGDLQGGMRRACLDLFEPAEVAGYQPVYQAPEFQRLWFSAKSIPARYQMADELISGPAHLQADLMAWVGDPANVPDFAGADPVGNPGPHPGARIATHLVQTLIEGLLPEALDQDRLAHFEQLLLDGLSPINWMFEWDHYLDTNDATSVKPQIEKLLRGLLQSPEYQLA